MITHPETWLSERAGSLASERRAAWRQVLQSDMRPWRVLVQDLQRLTSYCLLEAAG